MKKQFVENINEPTVKIKVFGLGGGGGNAVENMIAHKVEGVDFAIANTDRQALEKSKCKEKILLGVDSTGGLGAGANPNVGKKACMESKDAIINSMKGYDMIFLAAGMGGGTGTAAVAGFAEEARKLGILTVAVVTKPFTFEGRKRMEHAEKGLEDVLKVADSTVIISNNNLRSLIGRKPAREAFAVADDVLRSAVQTITNLVNKRALINLDFADVCTTMRGQGHAVLGIGIADIGEGGAIQAAEQAVSNKLLENSIKSATQAIINISGGPSISLFDAEDAVNRISEETETEINTIFGVDIDEDMGNKIQVTVIATGFDENSITKNQLTEAEAPSSKAIPKKDIEITHRPTSTYAKTDTVDVMDFNKPKEQPYYSSNYTTPSYGYNESNHGQASSSYRRESAHEEDTFLPKFFRRDNRY